MPTAPEPNSGTETQELSLAQKLISEPTVHFLVIAILIFALFAWVNRNSENILEIDQREIDARIFMQELSTGEELSEQQRDFITNSFVEEQILVNEALALGLDNDARIHDLLAQKMRHVLSGGIIQPTEEELGAYYEENVARYELPASIDLEELVFDTREPLADNIRSLLAANTSSEELLILQPGIAAPLNNVTATDLRNIFDEDYAQRVFSSEDQDWTGPFLSNRGQHWLRILARRPARLLPLEEITDRVRLEWITEEEDALLQAEINKLWDKYSIRIVEGSGDE